MHRSALNRLVCLTLLAICPMLAGAWTINYPLDNTYVPFKNATGTGNAPGGADVEFRIMEPNGMDVDDSVIGTATGEGEGGGWSLTIDGPMTPSPNTTPPTHDHSAQLRDGDGNIKDTSANIGVWQ